MHVETYPNFLTPRDKEPSDATHGSLALKENINFGLKKVGFKLTKNSNWF